MAEPLTTRQKLARKIWKFCLRNHVSEHEIIAMLSSLADDLEAAMRVKNLQDEAAELMYTITILEGAYKDSTDKSVVDEYKTRLAQVQGELSQLPHTPNPR
jgi:hypothetical protein